MHNVLPDSRFEAQLDGQPWYPQSEQKGFPKYQSQTLSQPPKLGTPQFLFPTFVSLPTEIILRAALEALRGSQKGHKKRK